MDSELETKFKYDEMEDKLHVSYKYDAAPILEQNKVERDQFTTFKKAETMGGLVKCASLHQGDVERLMNLGYNILSPDPDEVKRAVLFIQVEQQKLLTVEGKPFARKKTTWE